MIEGVKHRLSRINIGQLAVLCLMLGVFIIIMVLPIFALFIRAFQDNAGQFAGFENYRAYFGYVDFVCVLRGRGGG